MGAEGVSRVLCEGRWCVVVMMGVWTQHAGLVMSEMVTLFLQKIKLKEWR